MPDAVLFWRHSQVWQWIAGVWHAGKLGHGAFPLRIPAAAAAPAAVRVCAQDVNSRSRLVRLYYSNRIFMGFCCVCCEVLYLALFLLHLPAYQTLGLMDVQVSKEGK